MSKLHSIRARIRRISRYARLFAHSHQRFSLGQRGIRADLLSTNATTWTNREGLGEIFHISLKMLVAKPAFRGEEIWFCEVRRVAMSCMGAELHVCLQWKKSAIQLYRIDDVAYPSRNPLVTDTRTLPWCKAREPLRKGRIHSQSFRHNGCKIW